jgi:hypothetical protein
MINQIMRNLAPLNDKPTLDTCPAAFKTWPVFKLDHPDHPAALAVQPAHENLGQQLLMLKHW